MTLALKSLKNLHFHWFLLCKVFNVWPKKVQRSYLSWHWRVMQNLKKTDLWSEKWHEKFGKFSPEHLKVSKLGLWLDAFVQSRECMSLKFTEELCVMKMKNNTKFEEELTCLSILTWGIWWNLTWELKNLKNLLFDWLLWSKYITFELKKVQRSYVWWHWRLMQNLKENSLKLSKMTWGIW